MLETVREITTRFRVGVYQALSSPARDGWRPVKVVREVLGTLNDVTGRPFCSREELAAREARRRAAVGGAASVAPARREAAPVMLYFDGKDHRTKQKMEEVLRARNIPFQLLDCTDDEATRSWAETAARSHEFPLLFIAGEPVGGLHELTQLDVSGKLVKRVFGR